MSDLHVVTGAFGYSGKYIAKRLLADGHTVRTLTDSPNRRNDFGDTVDVSRYHFESPSRLVKALKGAKVLYNTYWVRFNHNAFQHSTAVANTLKLFDAAREAGVERIVHTSISNPSEESPLEYFRGKAQLEKALMDLGVSYAILRPAVLFGHEDILVNNIAWMLRKLPVFGVFGFGKYRLQPIFVDDLAALAVNEGQNRENRVVEAIGPETFEYRELVEKIGRIIGVKRPILPTPPFVAYWAAWLMGKLVGDVMVTRDEIKGFMADLLYTDAPAAGTTKLTEWAEANKDTLGLRYSSELARRRNREKAYDQA